MDFIYAFSELYLCRPPTVVFAFGKVYLSADEKCAFKFSPVFSRTAGTSYPISSHYSCRQPLNPIGRLNMPEMMVLYQHK